MALRGPASGPFWISEDGLHALPESLVYDTGRRAIDLAGTLGRLEYARTSGAPSAPGHFRRTDTTWDIYLRGFEAQPASRLRIDLRGDRVARVLHDGQEVPSTTLPPEVLTVIENAGSEAVATPSLTLMMMFE